uniref:RING-type domain-containing protein n=1 Tax=Kalanchoe fedtschenkoi TaxID=63787 RepID=A0A7N0UZ21_KALFE
MSSADSQPRDAPPEQFDPIDASDLYETIVRRAYARLQAEIGKMVKTVAEGGGVCAICLNELEAGRVAATLPCTHVFHKVCVATWLWENHSCPTCRADVWPGGGGRGGAQGG